ncbi:MAG: flagellar biosynthesis anti-sigma factor FlgM, partial [Thermodesulfobacteriota bacterium]
MKISEINNEFIKQYKINKQPDSVPQSQINENIVLEEKVSISSISSDIKLAKDVIEELPDVREERVRELRQQIEQGTYIVDGEKIAAKIFSDL